MLWQRERWKPSPSGNSMSWSSLQCSSMNIYYVHQWIFIIFINEYLLRSSMNITMFINEYLLRSSMNHESYLPCSSMNIYYVQLINIYLLRLSIFFTNIYYIHRWIFTMFLAMFHVVCCTWFVCFFCVCLCAIQANVYPLEERGIEKIIGSILDSLTKN